MLETEKPDFVSIAPSWVTERVPMIEAAAAAGCHIYCEKPVAGSLAEVDAIVAACQSAEVKMAVAHQWRAMRPIQKLIEDVQAGKFGKLLRVRTRPKDDSRGGGEELLLHGTHLFDLMMAFTGEPRWASGHVTVNGRDATTADTGQGNAPVGPIIGDSISAVFGFDNGVRGFFDSTADLAIPSQSNFDNLYGLSLECERAALELREPGDVYIYPAPRVLPDLQDLAWERVWMPEWHELPEHAPQLLRKNWLSIGNKTLARDLINAAETDREPLSSIRMVRFVNEMVQGVYSSHLLAGRRIAIPLTDRAHPLGES
jgi:predicted dehydrogenase